MEPSTETNKEQEEEQVVTPWEVSGKDGGKIDYDKLIDRFGCQRIDQSLIQRVEQLTSQPAHVFLHLGVFFAHRDFSEVLNAYEKGDKFYLYTGRGPSSESLHLGHLIPFMFTKEYDIKCIIDLHAALDSQNGMEHSASRDGFTGWPTSPDYISKSLHVIEFLISRYAKHPALLGIEILNEPSAGTVSLDILISYYKQGYQIVRKYSSSAYVIVCQRIGNADPLELYQANIGSTNLVLDLHFYNLFGRWSKVDPLLAMTACLAIERLSEDDKTKLLANNSVRIFGILESIITGYSLPTNIWYVAADKAITAIYVVQPTPETIADDMINKSLSSVFKDFGGSS